MSIVKAVTEKFIFKARVASFYELNTAGTNDLVQEFGKWLKEQGKEHEFLVWSVELIREAQE